jgi:hypothetical protein
VLIRDSSMWLGGWGIIKIQPGLDIQIARGGIIRIRSMVLSTSQV